MRGMDANRAISIVTQARQVFWVVRQMPLLIKHRADKNTAVRGVTCGTWVVGPGWLGC